MSDPGGARTSASKDLPLRGLRVTDLTQVLAGPFATMLLADLGAEVIKVERPPHGDPTRGIAPLRNGESHYFLSVNRNKKGIAADLTQAGGLRVVRDLVARSDVVVENFRPGVAARLGVDYGALSALNPQLVYCSISAFGQTGPWSSRGAFDVAVQALSGVMSVTGERGGRPLRAGVPVADLAGGMFGVVGILAALHERERTGRGRHVDCSLLDSTVSLLTYLAESYFMTGEEPDPVGSGHPSLVPYEVFAASDGYIVVATLTDASWRKLCDAIGRPDLRARDDLATSAQRLQHRDEVDQAVASAIATGTVSHWEKVLGDADVPHAPILGLSQALSLPQLVEREMVQELDHPAAGHIHALGRAIHFSDQGREPLLAPPRLGEHTVEVLDGILGYPRSVIDELLRSGSVAVGSSPTSTVP